MKIKQYRPAYFEGFKNEINEFATKEDILNIEWIKEWQKDAPGSKFTGFFVSKHYLLATFNYNTNQKATWWVVGIFLDDEGNKAANEWFPQWEEPEYIMKNGDVIDIVCTYGNIIEYRKYGDPEGHKSDMNWLSENLERNRYPRESFVKEINND